jgi:hypothetical protein
MVSETIALEQVNRLWQLNYYPRDPEQSAALRELVTAAQGADSENCLKTAITAILYDSEDCPKPADIRRVVRVENERERELEAAREKEKPRPGPCPFCYGIGFATRTYLLTRTTEEIDGEVRMRVTKKYLISDEEIEAAKKSLAEGQEVISGGERCSCQTKMAS